MSKLEFGLGIAPTAPQNAGPVQDSDPVRVARRAEELGFDFVSTSDHPSGTEPTYETWTLLCWIAAATSRIRIAPRVLGVPYRAPAMVAKMAETFDRLSGGRLILGLGGGYSDHEFRGFGLPVPTPREKVDGLEDAIRIARGLWTEPSFSYHGRRFHTDAAELQPKPDRQIPIWLGTFGDRALALTGRLADGWIPSLGSAPPEQAIVMRDKIFKAAEGAGRDPGSITCAYHIQVSLQPDEDPSVVSGSPDQIATRLHDFTKLGFTALSLSPVGPDPAETVERLGVEVLPAVRDLS
jgi:alkanesulfonate monooxygenase SsuD/methylene tetrahydromethanopterin reductase-like flavin-dependent oxidoreductase (luciferase family)